MRKLLGSALLLAVVAFVPTEAAAQRRAAPRPTPSAAQKPSFGLELNWSSDVDFGIGGRGVFPLQSLFPRTPIDGMVSFDYFFPSAPAGVSAHYWEINGDVAYRFRVPARSSFRPYAGGGLRGGNQGQNPSILTCKKLWSIVDDRQQWVFGNAKFCPTTLSRMAHASREIADRVL